MQKPKRSKLVEPPYKQEWRNYNKMMEDQPNFEDDPAAKAEPVGGRPYVGRSLSEQLQGGEDMSRYPQNRWLRKNGTRT